VFRLPANKTLGTLQRRLLSALWRRGDATVHELIECGDFSEAYGSLLTALTRLHQKQLVDRVKDGPGRWKFRFKPRCSEAEFERSVAIESFQQLLKSETTASVTLSFLVEAISECDARLLDVLEQAIEEKRSLHSADKNDRRGPG
jgi:predicted transcriptional regulator